MRTVKVWDAIVVGGGIIGLSLAIELRKRGRKVLIVERGEPGHEASHAAAGMLADCSFELPSALMPLATFSAQIYPEFVHELQDESGMNVDLRDAGTILVGWDEHLTSKQKDDLEALQPASVERLEPTLDSPAGPVFFRKECSVDPRLLGSAAILAAKHRNVDIVTGKPVTNVCISSGHVTGVMAGNTTYTAPIVVNCAGAWSGAIGPFALPVHPVKGHMLSLVGVQLQHVVRTPRNYLVPRRDGRIVIGSTLENNGYDKRVDGETIQRLRHAGEQLIPSLREAKMLEAWTGLRPATTDHLPVLGATTSKGYFVATGHFRDGILLAPATARLMAQVICGEQSDCDVSAFSPLRFEQQQRATG